MYNVGNVKAFYKREQFYETLKLQHSGDAALKDTILKAFQVVSLSTGITPGIHDENTSNNSQSLCIDLEDTYLYHGGEFILNMLLELHIQECEVA